MRAGDAEVPANGRAVEAQRGQWASAAEPEVPLRPEMAAAAAAGGSAVIHLNVGGKRRVPT